MPTLYIAQADHLPDSPHWINRFKYTSDSGRTYVIAQNKAYLWCGCTCQAWTFQRHCKHLDNLGLPGGEKPCEVEVIITDAPRSMATPSGWRKPRTRPAFTEPPPFRPAAEKRRAPAPQPQPPAETKRPRRAFNFDD